MTHDNHAHVEERGDLGQGPFIGGLAIGLLALMAVFTIALVLAAMRGAGA
jgi:hypothetical protein